MTKSSNKHSAWDPGIEPDIPTEYQHLETLYNPANVFTTLEQIQHVESQSGLQAIELTAFKPHRLALQEVIIRVTADILVREGEKEEELGILFREITRDIMQFYIEPALPQINQRFTKLNLEVENTVRAEIKSTFFSQNPDETPVINGFWRKLFANKNSTTFSSKTPLETALEREFRLISEYKSKAYKNTDKYHRAIFQSLFRVLGNIVNKRGFLGRDLDWLTSVCTQHVTNKLGREVVSQTVDNLVQQAIKEKSYTLIPDADEPVLISLKGTSAAGKSSLRPRLREMMQTLGVENLGYGIISPDIWRKLLLDYDSLGNAYKYAGRMTSLEVNIIDAQLDRYIRNKSRLNNAIPHLLVDRFRFDSFASENIAKILHKTYASNIHHLYMFFVITPPEATVERGWLRGLERGRYKCVEDFLGHSVEAYSGIPKIFFKWMNLKKPYFVFEFLDNSVEKGQYPTLIARGTQDVIDIYDPLGLINIERYQKINIMARTPDEVYPSDEQMTVANNTVFLRQCINTLSVATFVDRETDIAYMQTLHGKPEILDKTIFDSKAQEVNHNEIFKALFPLWKHE